MKLSTAFYSMDKLFFAHRFQIKIITCCSNTVVLGNRDRSIHSQVFGESGGFHVCSHCRGQSWFPFNVWFLVKCNGCDFACGVFSGRCVCGVLGGIVCFVVGFCSDSLFGGVARAQQTSRSGEERWRRPSGETRDMPMLLESEFRRVVQFQWK